LHTSGAGLCDSKDLPLRTWVSVLEKRKSRKVASSSAVMKKLTWLITENQVAELVIIPTGTGTVSPAPAQYHVRRHRIAGWRHGITVRQHIFPSIKPCRRDMSSTIPFAGMNAFDP
jgi:hypothetical protein